MPKDGILLAKNVLAVSNVKASERRTYYRIKGEPGLILAVYPTGRRNWFARYQTGRGKARRQTYYEIGSADVVTLADACARNNEVRVIIQQGGDPSKERRDERTAPTFAELVGR